MRVNVYVEGPSDVAAMNELLRPLLEQKQQAGILIRFIYVPKGDGKKTVLFEVPRRAADTILGDPSSVVVAMPDLYPRNKGFPHETVDEIEAGIQQQFIQQLGRGGRQYDNRTSDRFKVFCFKYELEALILAAEEALCSRLGVKSLPNRWIRPVEDQNHDNPPSKIVETLFYEFLNEPYEKTAEAPLILGNADYKLIADRCPQCFKPFVDFLTNLQ